MKNKGFSTTELLTSVAVVGIMSALGVGAYTFYIPKAQSKEAGQMMMHQMLELSSQVKKGACTTNGNPLSIKGKYGTLLVSGTPVKSPGSSCPSGCNMQYTFGGAGVHNQLNGKVFVVDALNNGKLSQANGTTLAEKYWPAGISKLPVNAGDSCTAIAKTPPSTTDGSVSGTEVGDAEPTPPSPPTGSTTPPPTGSTTPPTTPTNPTPPPETPPSGGATAVDLGTIHINSTYGGTNQRDSGYYVKNTVNIYDAIISNLKITPNGSSKVNIIVYADVAVVGNSTVMGAFEFDNRLPAGMEVTIENNGYILGRGGAGSAAPKPARRCLRDEWGESLGCKDDWYYLGERGGNAITGGGYGVLKITNRGIIAGGGGGGWGRYDFDHGQDGGGGWRDYGSGGAPLGQPGGWIGRTSSLLSVARPEGDTGGGGNGGAIGSNASPTPKYAGSNKNPSAQAGCPYIGSNIKINNAGSGRILVGVGCPSIQGF